MELQIFTFFILAFVALTDGVPRKMDGSIDMTKPEHAKADLARARAPTLEKIERQAVIFPDREGWEVIDVASDEAKHLAEFCIDWKNRHPNDLNPHENPWVLGSIYSAEKQPSPELGPPHYNYKLFLELKDGEETEYVWFCPFRFWGPGLKEGEEFDEEMVSGQCGMPPYIPETTPAA